MSEQHGVWRNIELGGQSIWRIDGWTTMGMRWDGGALVTRTLSTHSTVSTTSVTFQLGRSISVEFGWAFGFGVPPPTL